MAHLGDNSQPTAQRLGLINDMMFGNMTMPPERHTKEIVPPPVDPFSSSSNSGMYIPPEETKQCDGSLDEIMGWGMSDDQQDSEEDDDMDDNAFDLDFEDVDYPPPIRPEDQTPGLCQRHMSHPKFNDLQSMPYIPPHSTVPYHALVNRGGPTPPEDMLGIDNDAPPVQFINPSSLHLPFQWSFDGFSTDGTNNITNSNINTTNLNPNRNTNLNPNTNNPNNGINTNFNNSNNLNTNYADSMNVGGVSPGLDTRLDHAMNPVYSAASSPALTPYSDKNTAHSSVSPQSTPRMGLLDLDFDVAASDPYPMVTDTSPEVSKDAFYQNSEPEIQNLESQAQLPSPASSPHNSESISFSNKPSKELNEQAAEEPSSLRKTSTTPEVVLPSTIDRQPRRKVNRRRANVSHRASPKASSSHSSAHVCNMTFPDGTECHRSFTRPYDLARHQETLHAAVRKMYTCEACGEHSKTFSRLDALSRHMRLKHS